MTPTIQIPTQYKDYEDLVFRIAHSYPENSRCEFNDYVNVGLAALAQAERDFDPGRGVQFITYAYIVVKTAIEKEFQDNVNALSGCTPYFINEVDGTREYISYLNNSMVSISETKKSLDDRFQQEGWKFSLNAPLKEVIVESGIVDPERVAEVNEMRDKIIEIIDTLEPQEKDIVYRRLYEGDTFQAIADAKNITWRTAYYHFYRSLEKLKDKLQEAGLDIYV